MHSRTTSRPRLFTRALWLPAALIAAVALVAVLSPVEAATLNVDGTVGCDDVAGAPYCTIQAAIDASLDGDTISVAAGTYVEQLVINKDVTISGQPGAILQPTGNDEAWDIQFVAGGSGATLEGFTLDFNGAADDRPGRGIGISDFNGPAITNVTIQNNDITMGVGIGAATVGLEGVGIQTGVNADVSGLTISDNEFHGGAAVIADGANAGEEGIYINPNGGAGAITISNNTFDGQLFTGISIESDNVTVSGNTVSRPAAVQNTNGIRVNDFVGGVTYNVTITTGNTVRGFANGIRVGRGSEGASTLTVTLTNNIINANDRGVFVRYDAAVTATGNQITNSATIAAEIEAGSNGTLSAENNWWGSAAGPGGAISAGVDADPWCTNAACTTFSDDPPPPAPGPAPTPTPTPTPDTVETDGDVVVEVENEVTASASAQTDVVVETSSAQGTIRVTAPAGALPAGSTLSVAAAANLDGMLAQAEPPLGTSVLMAFVVRALDANGNRLTDNFAAPVTLAFELAAHAVPADASERTLVVAFWNGERWVEVEGEVTRATDGTWTLTVSVMHFTLFAVLHQPDRGLLLPEPAFAGVSLTTWGGGPLTLLPPAKSYWVTAGGILVGYVPGAPDFVNAVFFGRFPEGDIPAGTALLVVR